MQTYNMLQKKLKRSKVFTTSSFSYNQICQVKNRKVISLVKKVNAILENRKPKMAIAYMT